MKELITIITVGIALAGLILTLAGFQAEANREVRREFAQLNQRVGYIEQRVGYIEQRVGHIEQRVAHIEGLLEGLAGSEKISL